METTNKDEKIAIAAPLADIIKCDRKLTEHITLNYIKNYLDNPINIECYIDDIRKYQKLLYALSYKVKYISSPFYEGLNTYKLGLDGIDIRESISKKLFLLLEQISLNKSCLNVIKAWDQNIINDGYYNLNEDLIDNINNCIPQHKLPDLNLFLPPMIYAEIREELA